MRLAVYDNPQQTLGFLQSQTSFIESEVYRIQYPEIIYQQLIPIDSSAGQWTKSITYYSLDKVGQAKWLNATATDMPYADINRNKFEQGIEMAGIGYSYNIEEVGQAMMIPGLNLTAERAEAAQDLRVLEGSGDAPRCVLLHRVQLQLLLGGADVADPGARGIVAGPDARDGGGVE